jgi:hypothetical protein
MRRPFFYDIPGRGLLPSRDLPHIVHDAQRVDPIVPQGHDGDWDIAGPVRVSHVFLPDDHLSVSAEQLGCSNGVELLSRVVFDDPVASRLYARRSVIWAEPECPR